MGTQVAQPYTSQPKLLTWDTMGGCCLRNIAGPSSLLAGVVLSTTKPASYQPTLT
jgi:hypothetical protein